ncbi:RNA polymerase sigma factor [Flavobacterium branchiophilum]|uniref:RNA polymerase ECF-type sigma factor n=1 Tax=Flavobacterium branchiophilum (strain FL-15) TaxID=1034807 RepID=G2Z0P5_FLABF|nr:RNA polymerase sigma factor [Flavobacterium branchiophilum]CCB69453.1 RNA polymerase ECF-type sigma factor [Flavobacterium branchiophilum FL-15]
MKNNSPNIARLIALCIDKNTKAQHELYHLYANAMYNVAFRIIKDEHFAQDIMQEGFLKAFSNLEKFKNEVAFGAWLKRIIVNCSIDFCKKEKRISTDEWQETLHENIEIPTEVILNDVKNFQVQQILNAMKSLKDSYNVLLSLYYIEGYDQEEICDILQISNANFRTTLSRAKESLRIKFKKNEINER